MSLAQYTILIKRGYGLTRPQRAEFLNLVRKEVAFCRLAGDTKTRDGLRKLLIILKRLRVGAIPAKKAPMESVDRRVLG